MKIGISIKKPWYIFIEAVTYWPSFLFISNGTRFTRTSITDYKKQNSIETRIKSIDTGTKALTAFPS